VAKKRSKAKPGASKSKANNSEDTFSGVSLSLIGILVFFSFISLDGRNLLGPFGESVSRLLFVIAGRAAYLIPFIIWFYSYNLLRKEHKYSNLRHYWGFALSVFTVSLFISLFVQGGLYETFRLQRVESFYAQGFKAAWQKLPPHAQVFSENYNFAQGGFITRKIALIITGWFSVIGAYIITIILAGVSAVLLGKEELLITLGRKAHEAAIAVAKFAVKLVAGMFNNESSGRTGKPEKEKPVKKKETKKTRQEKEEDTDESEENIEEEEEKEEDRKPKKREKLNVISHEEKPKKPAAISVISKGGYTLPSIDMLKAASGGAGGEVKDYTADAERLKKTLKDFGIDGEVVNVVDGPVISRFEIELATGTKVAKVQNLEEDIALAMKVEQVRIAPVADKSLLGIEVPKSAKKMIVLRELIEHEKFQESDSLLTMAIGKDLGGKPIIAELGKMPHLLIAGATGSGKSVCVNSIIMSIIYKASPDEVKLLLVDPKRVELTVYRDIPHLIAPVITDPKHAAYALKKLTYEMDYRYDILSKEGARDIATYNRMVFEFNEQLKTEPDYNQDDLKKSLPYIILVIDELADLMTLAKANVEASLQRLAQLARAVGIHIILATQRPSVDVITGVIKANFPSRIAFQVMSQVDSRTILDMKGAESLLGRGDMLYAPSDINKPIRGQACFVSGDEISKVTHFIKKQRKPDISPEFDLKEEDADLLLGDDGSPTGAADPLFQKAVELAKAKGNISTSYLQRKLGIGYSKAARIIDDMEEKGIVSAADGNKPREYTGS